MHRTSKLASLLATAAVIGSAVPALAQDAPVAFTLWTKDGPSDGGLQFVQKLADEYTAAHPNVTITVVNKDVEKLRQDFLTTAIAHNEPELLWTAGDHAGPFTVADVIQPVDGLVDINTFLPQALGSVQLDGQTWGIPVSFGNHLMLYTNKDLIPECPADTDALIAAAKAQTSGGSYGFAFPQTEAFWVLPFLGAFGGTVFGEDGVTATLDTPAMVSALTFLKDLKFTDQIVPSEVSYAIMDGMFKNGAPGAAPAAASLAPSQTPPPSGIAASVMNGDWTLGAYADLFGDKLNVCPLPQVTGADWIKPYLAGEYLMFSKDLANDAAKQAAVVDFAKFVTEKTNQLDMVATLKRLPGLTEAFNDPAVTGDPLLALSAAATEHGIGTPPQVEMRCVWDAVTAGAKTLFKGADSDPAAIAKQMQADFDQNALCMQ
jgi:arabinogalactan oligomer/maltooligosaccharide transport system substrate-binding protein